MAEPLLAVWGADHHRSPVALRERLAVAGADAPALAAELRRLPGASGAVVISTCNRLECLVSGSIGRQEVDALVGARAGVAPATLAGHAYWHCGTAAGRHLHRVAAGLESLVLGEAEIVGQVKRAYEACRAAGTADGILHLLCQRALAAAKEVRTRTALGDHKLSVASVAVDLARQVHGDLASARLLVVGAGETAELAVRYLAAAGVTRIAITNRSPERAADLARRQGAETVPWADLGRALGQADVVVSSTAAPHPVISAAAIAAARQSSRRPLVLIDLAVPRDIEPDAARIDDVFLFNVDHLEQVVAGNRRLRQEEVAAAETLVEAAVAAWLQAADPAQGELLARIVAHVRTIAAEEEARLAGRLPPGADREQVRHALERVGNRLAHPVLAWIKEHGDDPEALLTATALLGLPEQQPGGDPARTHHGA